ncbi:DUF3486 family protein [Stenotrophomonas maltophilia]
MPPPSKTLQLPKELLDQLNARLRSNGYGELEKLSAWLGTHGHHIGKSALGRHSLKLREVDAHRGELRAVLCSHPQKRKVKPGLPLTADDVLTELGRLRARELALLAHLDQLTDHSR